MVEELEWARWLALISSAQQVVLAGVVGDVGAAPCHRPLLNEKIRSPSDWHGVGATLERKQTMSTISASVSGNE